MPDPLSIYLNDHLAAAAGGVALARRARDAHEGLDEPTAAVLRAVTIEIEADRHQLQRITQRVGVHRDPLKQAAAMVAERIGRLKANGRIVRRSPLSSLIELEGLSIAVQGKRCGWKALLALDDDRLDATELERLVERAESQHERLERQRLHVAARVLRGEDLGDEAPSPA